MKILIVSDEECQALWDYYQPGRLRDYDLILSCGDLDAKYLSFLVTMARCPVLYVHGNHDADYHRHPPEGCDCIDDHFVVYNGVRILGLGGCRRYHPGPHQYTDAQMLRRILRLSLQILRAGGVDIVVTHAPPEGIGDGADPAHRGFAAFHTLLRKYRPGWLVHGHMHLRYTQDKTRVRSLGETRVINCSERYVLEIPDRDFPEKSRNQVIWRTKYKNPYRND